MVKTEGVLPLLKRGLVLTMVRDSVPLGLMVMAMDQVPVYLSRLNFTETISSFLSSMVALVCAWTFYPADKIKSSIQAVRKDK